MTRSVHVDEIHVDQVHQYDYCDNANVTEMKMVLKNISNVHERIGHPIMCSSNDTACKSMLSI